MPVNVWAPLRLLPAPSENKIARMPSPVTASSPTTAGRLGVVLTGGTVGSQITRGERGEVVDLADVLTGAKPEIGLLESAIEGVGGPEVPIARPMASLSESLLPADWVSIAEAARGLIEHEGASRIVILHGTDTMAYTAAALSFLLADVAAPIVLTGSNLPPDHPRSDAAKNLHDTLVAIPLLRPGVYIAFAGGARSPGWVHVGTRARKVRASGPAFASVNRQPAGKVVDGRFLELHPLDREQRPSRPPAVDDRVLALRLYPGIDFEAIWSMIEAGSFTGVMLELYACATAPRRGSARNSAPEFVRRACARGVAVVAAVPAAPAGTPSLYEATIELEDAGAVFVHDMLPETATVKLMWVLAQSGGREDYARMMLDPVAEELRVS